MAARPTIRLYFYEVEHWGDMEVPQSAVRSCGFKIVEQAISESGNWHDEPAYETGRITVEIPEGKTGEFVRNMVEGVVEDIYDGKSNARPQQARAPYPVGQSAMGGPLPTALPGGS